MVLEAGIEQAVVAPVGDPPQDGLTVQAFYTKNGTAFVACENAVVELTNGYYSVVLKSKEVGGPGTLGVTFESPGKRAGFLFLAVMDFEQTVAAGVEKHTVDLTTTITTETTRLNRAIRNVSGPQMLAVRQASLKKP